MVVLVLALFSLQNSADGQTFDQPVANNSLSQSITETSRKDYPWVVAIFHAHRVNPICLGVIISKMNVITSCHCVAFKANESNVMVKIRRRLLHVIGGNNDLSSTVHQSSTVVSVVLHPSCSPQESNFNVAILEMNLGWRFRKWSQFLKTAPIFSRVRAEIQTKLTQLKKGSAECTILDYGYFQTTTDPRHVYSPKLWQHLTRFNPIALCQTPSLNISFDDDNAICQSEPMRVGPCGVLPGAPLICEGFWFGIHVYDNCPGPSFPVAIVATNSFHDFFVDYISGATRNPSIFYFHLIIIVLHYSIAFNDLQ